jgi:hypothetical protein
MLVRNIHSVRMNDSKELNGVYVLQLLDMMHHAYACVVPVSFCCYNLCSRFSAITAACCDAIDHDMHGDRCSHQCSHIQYISQIQHCFSGMMLTDYWEIARQD